MEEEESLKRSRREKEEGRKQEDTKWEEDRGMGLKKEVKGREKE